MLKRKSYLIDKKFQLKKSIIIISSVMVIIALIIISAGTVIVLNNRQVGINNIRMMDNIKGIEKNIQLQQDCLMKDLLKPDNKVYYNTGNRSDEVIKDYNNSMDTLNTSIRSDVSLMEENKNITLMNTWLFIAIIVVSVIGIVVLFIQLILQSHRVSGPVLLMTSYAKEVLNGEFLDMRDLREKDELKDFYVLFKQMAGRIIELEKKSKG